MGLLTDHVRDATGNAAPVVVLTSPTTGASFAAPATIAIEVDARKKKAGSREPRITSPH